MMVAHKRRTRMETKKKLTHFLKNFFFISFISFTLSSAFVFCVCGRDNIDKAEAYEKYVIIIKAPHLHAHSTR